MKKLSTSLIALFVFFAANITLAQDNSIDNAEISVSAEVLGAIQVIFGKDLEFGNVSPGVNKTVSPEDGEAGRFDITGGEGANILVSFTVPTALTDDDGNTLGITFGAESAGLAEDDNASGIETFDPGSGNSAALPASGESYLFIGGTVEPTNAQVAASYSAEITVTVEYE